MQSSIIRLMALNLTKRKVDVEENRPLVYHQLHRLQSLTSSCKDISTALILRDSVVSYRIVPQIGPWILTSIFQNCMKKKSDWENYNEAPGTRQKAWKLKSPLQKIKKPYVHCNIYTTAVRTRHHYVKRFSEQRYFEKYTIKRTSKHPTR